MIVLIYWSDPPGPVPGPVETVREGFVRAPILREFRAAIAAGPEMCNRK
jgi:hypothetical protein